MRTLFLLMVVYVGIYAYLSAHGSYQTTLATAAKGVPVPARAWQPKGCELSMRRAGDQDHYNVDGNKLGLVFMPAIVVDRRTMHKDRTML